MKGSAITMTEPLRDKNGLTEEEFLAAYSPTDYPRPSLTADNCIFRLSRWVSTARLVETRADGPSRRRTWPLTTMA